MSWCVGRYDDIWPSYVVRRIADHLHHRVAYGYPLLFQERNPHNYYTDFDNERMGMQSSVCGDDYYLRDVNRMYFVVFFVISL